MNKEKTLTSIFYVSGLHCGACELIIEKKIKKIKNVDNIKVSGMEKITIFHNNEKEINVKNLNKIFEEDSYVFSNKKQGTIKNSEEEISCCESSCGTKVNYLNSILIFLAVISGYILLSKSGLSALVSVSENSSLPAFLLFGLIAGFSSCAALVGGILLSMSKQWMSLYKTDDSLLTKSEPHILFNTGRLIGYVIFGGILGGLGSFFTMSPIITASLVMIVSIVMILLGLQMIGVKALNKLQIKLPKFITKTISDEKNFNGKFAPFLMGSMTFLLPCGFTITAQALALISGDMWRGTMIMGLFALGTMPGLLLIGLGSVKLHNNPKLSKQFSFVAGLLVLYFAAFNINAQLAVLGTKNVSDISLTQQKVNSEVEIAPIVDGVQVVKIEAGSTGYTPIKIKMRANMKTRWEVKAINVSGCSNAIISAGLFEGQIDLKNGETAVKEFISPKAGLYKYSCWMGMIVGSVEIVDESGSAPVNAVPVESGVKGGGCGCGGKK